MTPLRRFFGLLKQDKKDLIYLYVYAICNGLINLSLPIGIQAIMGLVLAGRLSASWGILTLIVMVGVAVAGIFQIMQLYIVEILQRRLFARAAFDFAYRIPKFNIRKLGNHYAPELVNRFFDTVSIQKSMSKILMDFSTSILQILFGLILLSLYHPIFIAFGLALLLVLFFIIYFTSKPGMRTSLKESNNKYEMAFWLTELARALPTFKLSSSSDLNLKKTDGIVNKYLDSRKQHFKILLGQYGSIIGLKTAVTAGLLIIGALLLIQNSITIGQFVAAEIIIILILNSSEKLIMSMEAIYDVLTSIEKLGKVTDIEIEHENSNGMKLDADKAIGLEIKELTITGLLNKNIINKNLNFTIEPGTNVCFSGDTGSGKSSLIKILSTSHDNYVGSILYNGVPIQNLDLHDLRKHIGCIFNDQEIFNGTFIENISLGREGISTEDIIEISKEVGLNKLIESFPDGYNHVIMNADRVFSGTDRVRLLVARALISKPKLVFAEDLFSGLKENHSAELLTILLSRCKDTTLILVSNNEAVNQKCDTIIELS
ncbi:MAG: ABC transporter ATP-binding protein [Bacteroidia bacterium]|nr:ABC transporter ATP-binding protein [Bacteroidia bacterium]